MNFKLIAFNILGLALCFSSNAQHGSFDVSINVSFGENTQKTFEEDGRLFVFLNQSPQSEPRMQIWPSPGNYIFAKNFKGQKADQKIEISSSEGWSKTPEWDLSNVPEGEYFVQVLWDQDTKESRINAEGNMHSEKKRIKIDKSTNLEVELTEVIGPMKEIEHDLVKFVNIKSESLSKFWGRPIHVKASVLLPSSYGKDPNRAYPIRYNVAGYGGRYNRINRMAGSDRFMSWWKSDSAPQVITVYLDGEGPFGDSYQMDSDNSGPYGHSLVNEVIPYIEKEFRGTDAMETRFVDGCSTGGWVSLGLQLYYPDVFNGVFSYSPDAVEFENYQLVNIYQDENAYTNEHGYLRPVMRDVNGEPMMSLKKFINYENVLGVSNTYTTSGGQFSAHTALYSEKGADGLPKPMFDPVTGEIDHAVAETWKKYDFKKYAQKNWPTLGPKIEGKIFVWMGDMDHFYLNPATRKFSEYLETTKNPVSDAEIVFSPMKGHCAEFSDRAVLEQIEERLAELGKKQ